MPSTTFEVDAILFDMDGTLVSSTAGVVGAWHFFDKRYPEAKLDVVHILNTAHGVRTIDNLRQYFPMIPEEKLQSEAQAFEQAIVDYSTADGKKGINILPGVAEIIKELAPAAKLPNPAWAICTSATTQYATQALKISGIVQPDVFVTADHVKKGKPNPDPYLQGAAGVGVDPSKCLVVEDAVAGVVSGQRAGCKILGLCTTHDRAHMVNSKPDYLIDDLSFASVKLVTKEDGKRVVQVTVNEP